MSASYEIIMWETMGITAEQATRLLDSGLFLYKNERRYLELKAKGIPMKRMRFPRYMANKMAVIKSRMAQA